MHMATCGCCMVLLDVLRDLHVRGTGGGESDTHSWDTWATASTRISCRGKGQSQARGVQCKCVRTDEQ
jgi:hypothetical protein